MSDKYRRIVKLERSHRATSVVQHATFQSAASPTVEYAMNEFLQAKFAERAASLTIRDYKRHFQYLLTWLEQNHPNKKLSEITSTMLLRYVAWMTTTNSMMTDDHPLRPKHGMHGLSPVTVNVRIRTMCAFFNWCTRQGHFKKSPVRDIKIQKTDTESITAFDHSHIRKLLNAPNMQYFVGFRDYVIMIVLLDTGLRISKLFSLTTWIVWLLQYRGRKRKQEKSELSPYWILSLAGRSIQLAIPLQTR
jgi:integrase/recombinase XerD